MKKPLISIICALTDDRVIGYQNRIPWHIKDDLIRFKQKTTGHTVIMGRTTFESVAEYYKKSGNPVPNRKHVIITRDPSYSVPTEGCFVASSIDEALEKANSIEGEEIFISGGASIFEQTIGKADRLYLTVVHKQFEGDTYFPDYSQFKKVINREDKITSKGTPYTFLDLEK